MYYCLHFLVFTFSDWTWKNEATKRSWIGKHSCSSKRCIWAWNNVAIIQTILIDLKHWFLQRTSWSKRFNSHRGLKVTTFLFIYRFSRQQGSKRSSNRGRSHHAERCVFLNWYVFFQILYDDLSAQVFWFIVCNLVIVFSIENC